jgi:hypothetical protein
VIQITASARFDDLAATFLCHRNQVGVAHRQSKMTDP